jgi:hypothetical protein
LMDYLISLARTEVWGARFAVKAFAMPNGERQEMPSRWT